MSRPTAAGAPLARRRLAVTAAAGGLLLLAACGDSPTNPTAHELTPTSSHHGDDHDQRAGDVDVDHDGRADDVGDA